VSGYRITNIPCKFAQHFTDFVPMPFGSGNCAKHDSEYIAGEECNDCMREDDERYRSK